MSNNVKLQVLLRAVDQASRPFKSIRTASRSLSGDIRETQKSLRELNGHASRIEGFRKTSAQLAVTGHALEKARQEAEALATQFKNTERPTRAQAKVLESAKRAAEDLQAKYNRLTDSVKRQQRELAAVGINTRNLAHDEQGLKNRISETTAQLNRQRDALARVSAQQAKLNAVKQRYQAGKELAGNMASVGAAGVAVNSKVDEKHYSKFIAFENMRDVFIKNDKYKELIPAYDFYVATVYLLLLKTIVSNGVVNNKQLSKFVEYSFILKRKMELPPNTMGAFVCIPGQNLSSRYTPSGQRHEPAVRPARRHRSVQYQAGQPQSPGYPSGSCSSDGR